MENSSGCKIWAFIDQSLAATKYEFQVHSICGDETTEFSESEFFTTAEALACETPNNLSVEEAATQYFSLSWSSVEGAENYQIRYKKKGNNNCKPY